MSYPLNFVTGRQKCLKENLIQYWQTFFGSITKNFLLPKTLATQLANTNLNR